VRNPDASWRTRLMAVALAMFHRLRSLARERLGVSAGLRGNGMCFSSALLHKFPHKAFGLVEDVEYGIALGLGGVRVAYADEAKVLGEMVSSAAASESQRQRWEGGRKLLVRQKLPLLMGQALRQRNLMLFDLALDLATVELRRRRRGFGGHTRSHSCPVWRSLARGDDPVGRGSGGPGTLRCARHSIVGAWIQSSDGPCLGAFLYRVESLVGPKARQEESRLGAHAAGK
jgi:hypothetical protein